MDQLPYELLHEILQNCVRDSPKHDVLQLRLVCSTFDRILKPCILQTLCLDFERLSATLRTGRPRLEALASIGEACTSLSINLMWLQDQSTIDALGADFGHMDGVPLFCENMRQLICMGEATFTELEYFDTFSTMLRSCYRVERLALNLPYATIDRCCNASTFILANTLKALAKRAAEEDAARLKVLVIENLPDRTLCDLWANPIDVQNIIAALSDVEHLFISLHCFYRDHALVERFQSCFWGPIQRASRLKSLCIVGSNSESSPRGLKKSGFYISPAFDWAACCLPAPSPLAANLTCLELKRVDLFADALSQAIALFGPTLEELYLNEVYLKVQGVSIANSFEVPQVLWIGLPNQRPTSNCRWFATEVRYAMPRLRTCRASFLGYDYYFISDDDDRDDHEFDFIDPCGLGRSVAQRFVEVATGVRQPNSPQGEPVEFYPSLATEDAYGPGPDLKDRPRTIGVVDYDTNAHQMVVGNTTSGWKSSINGQFRHANKRTLISMRTTARAVSDLWTELWIERGRGPDWEVPMDLRLNDW